MGCARSCLYCCFLLFCKCNAAGSLSCSLPMLSTAQRFSIAATNHQYSTVYRFAEAKLLAMCVGLLERKRKCPRRSEDQCMSRWRTKQRSMKGKLSFDHGDPIHRCPQNPLAPEPSPFSHTRRNLAKTSTVVWRDVTPLSGIVKKIAIFTSFLPVVAVVLRSP